MRSRQDTKHGPAQYRATDTSQNQHKIHTNMLTSLNNPSNLLETLCLKTTALGDAFTHRMRLQRTGPCVQTLIKTRVFLNFWYLQVQSELLSRVSTVRGLFFSCLSFYLLSLSIAGNRQAHWRQRGSRLRLPSQANALRECPDGRWTSWIKRGKLYPSGYYCQPSL